MSEKPNKILVFVPNWVGDVVMATPVLRCLRENFPESKIACVGRAISLAVLKGSSWIDEYIEDTSRKKPVLKNLFATSKKIKDFNADVTLLMPNSFRSALLCKHGNAGKIIGYNRSGRGMMLDIKIQPILCENGATKYKPVPMLDYYARLTEPLGVSPDSRNMQLSVNDEGETQAAEILQRAGYDKSRPMFVINAGASFGTSKLWLPERFAELADELINRYDAQIVINAAPSKNEQAIAAKVTAAMKYKPLIDFSKETNSIAMLKSIISRCELMITNDTGTRHIAAAFGAAVVTIFGSTDPVWAQIDYPRERIVKVDVECGPCQKKICPLPEGPAHHQCITGVTVDMVLAACKELLEQQEAV